MNKSKSKSKSKNKNKNKRSFKKFSKKNHARLNRKKGGQVKTPPASPISVNSSVHNLSIGDLETPDRDENTTMESMSISEILPPSNPVINLLDQFNAAANEDEASGVEFSNNTTSISQSSDDRFSDVVA
jgi:hypothetical protein